MAMSTLSAVSVCFGIVLQVLDRDVHAVVGHLDLLGAGADQRLDAGSC